MPLLSMRDMLELARTGGFAVPLFDAFDSRSADGIFTAAEEKRAPVIVALYSSSMYRLNARGLGSYIKSRAEDSPVPVSFMLDHGRSPAECGRAIEMGASDVMFDGSALPIKENIARTAEVVREAHQRGIGVEAELGHVGQGTDYGDVENRRRGYTDPEEAVRFAEETGVDILAVAIGTAHGQYEGAPELDIDLLEQIRSRVSIPLALHGGSGLSEEQFRALISAGISKINVATDLYEAARRSLNAAALDERLSYHELGDTIENAVRERCGYYLEIFGTSGRAGT